MMNKSSNPGTEYQIENGYWYHVLALTFPIDWTASKVNQNKISVPTASPENVDVQQVNGSTVLLQWTPPLKRELHGDLKGYKVQVHLCFYTNSGSEYYNKLLAQEITFWINLKNKLTYLETHKTIKSKCSKI